MSRIRADRYTNRLGTGAPLFANGVNVTGNVGVGTTVPTSKLSVIGDMNVTGTVSVGGTLSYEDVTSIDSVGIITAQAGIHVTGGNVGIGTDNPGRALQISQANSTAYSGTDFDQNYHVLKLNNFTDSKTVGMQFLIGANGEAAITATETSDGATDLAFGTRGSGSRAERLRLTSAGRVAIGNATNNASPTALFGVIADDGEAADLYVGKFHNLEATAGQSYGVDIRAGSNSTDHGFRVKNRANTTTQFLVRGDGNIGIGTDNPSTTILTVRGSNNTTFTNNPCNMLLAGNDSATSGSSGSGIFFGGRYLDGSDETTTYAAISGIKENTTSNEYGGALVFGTRAAGSGGGSFERMRIDSNGYMTKAPSGMVIRSGFYDTGYGSGARTTSTSATFTTVNINGTGQALHNLAKQSANVLAYTKVSSNSHLIISVSFPFYIANGSSGFGIRCLLSTDNGGNYSPVSGLADGPANKWGAGGYGGNTSGIMNYTWNTRMNSSQESTIKAKTGSIRFYFEVSVWTGTDTLYMIDYPSYEKKGSIVVQEIAE